MNDRILPTGTLVYITSYGPYYGRKGMIQAIDCMGAEDSSSIAFYLVALQDEPGKMFWFEQDAIEASTGELVSGFRAERQ